ncbi:MAG: DUF1178 family protein [Novosphingobium sp.]
MIVFDLECREHGHGFEGWFGSSDDFVSQQSAGLLACPRCGSADVVKAVMAPAIGRKSNQLSVPVSARPEPGGEGGVASALPVSSPPLPPEAVRMMHQLAKMQAKVLETSRWVGGRFADDARAMHYGERDQESIHGEATPAEAEALIEEGIEIAPLPFPIAPPGKAN